MELQTELQMEFQTELQRTMPYAESARAKRARRGELFNSNNPLMKHELPKIQLLVSRCLMYHRRKPVPPVNGTGHM